MEEEKAREILMRLIGGDQELQRDKELLCEFLREWIYPGVQKYREEIARKICAPDGVMGREKIAAEVLGAAFNSGELGRWCAGGAGAQSWRAYLRSSLENFCYKNYGKYTEVNDKLSRAIRNHNKAVAKGEGAALLGRYTLTKEGVVTPCQSEKYKIIAVEQGELGVRDEVELTKSFEESLTQPKVHFKFFGSDSPPLAA